MSNQVSIQADGDAFLEAEGNLFAFAEGDATINADGEVILGVGPGEKGLKGLDGAWFPGGKHTCPLVGLTDIEQSNKVKVE